MTTKIPSGIIDHVISRAVEPSICSAKTPLRRRNLTANTTIAVKMATLTIADKKTRKTKSASTLPAVVEAFAGQSGKVSNIVRIQSSVVGRQSSACCVSICTSPMPDQHRHENSHDQNRRECGELQDARDDRSVLAGCRIVVIAVQQHLIGQVANLVLRGL